MNTTDEPTAVVDPVAAAAPRAGTSKRSLAWILVGSGGVLALLSLLSMFVDGAGELTTEGTSGATLRVSVPILLAGLGGLWSERSGVVNIGLEGMMILGTWFGAWAGYEFGPWWGVLFGVLGGALGGAVHALATVTFGVDHIISGVAINLLAAGFTRFLSETIFVNAGGGETQSPNVEGDLGLFTMPVLAGGDLFGWESPDVLGRIAAWDWVFASDAAGLARGLIAEVELLTLLALALVPMTGWLLWRTAFGLRLRACGENPYAAETLGINAIRTRYIAVIASGGFAGLGGAYLVLVSAGIYKENQTAGRGFLGLAAMVFGNWRPGGLATGAGLFGYASALEQRSDDAVHALILFVAALCALAAAWFVYRRRFRVAAALAAAAVAFWWWRDRVPSTDLPDEVANVLPYVTVLVVLAVARQRSRAPAMVGIPFRRGEER